MAKEIVAITGGTSGLGQGFVERFSKDGYEVSSIILALVLKSSVNRLFSVVETKKLVRKSPLRTIASTFK